MASNLAGGVNLGHFNACVFRAALLNADCSPTQGTNGGIVTAGLVTMTATPDVEEGTVFEPKTGCGSIAYTAEETDKIKRYNVSGEFIFFDQELMVTLFGGSLVLGAAGGDFAGEVIGWSAPRYDEADNHYGAYLEVITRSAAEGAGDCISAGTGRPTHFGNIFGKARLVPGERVFENGEGRVAFTGKATNNPTLFDGPWNDYPGSTYVPNSPYTHVGYSQAEYNAIEALVGVGFVDLPTAS